MLELQADLKELSQKLDVQEQSVRQAEREKTALIDELSQQNQRLTIQLQEANQLEAQLNMQLQEARDQYSQRNTSLQVSNSTSIIQSWGRKRGVPWGNPRRPRCKFYHPPHKSHEGEGGDYLLIDRLMWVVD